MDDEYFSAVKRNAAWAETFGGRRPTNMAERVRESKYNTDKAEYAAALVQRNEDALRSELATNKEAQDLFFRNEELKVRQAESAQKLKFNEEIHPLKLKAQQTLIRQREAQELKTTKSQELQNRMRADADLFLAERDSKLLENPNITDDELEDYDLELAKKFPYARRAEGTKEIITESQKSAARRKEESLKAKKAEEGGLVFSGISAGGNSMYKEPKDIGSDPEKRLQQIETLRERQSRNRTPDGKPADPDMITYLDQERERAAAEVQRTRETSATRERIAVNPKTGEKIVLRNGQWQPLTQ
jgi:hypothetical protein